MLAKSSPAFLWDRNAVDVDEMDEWYWQGCAPYIADARLNVNGRQVFKRETL
jgi:hypothetical protein